ncbi:MAG TPA: EAL domain-containing protein [Pseudolabrys sp.]|nr:EAL domain-containing protein [Pseudolabrys sp.]
MRIGAIFIAGCMVVIAGSLGAVAYLGLELDATTSAVLALAALAAMLVYRVGSRLRDRMRIEDQIAALSRGTADLAHQVADVSRRVGAIETRVGATLEPGQGAPDPLAAELGELSGLVQQLANAVAAHDAILQQGGAAAGSTVAMAIEAPPVLNKNGTTIDSGRFSGMTPAQVADLIGRAVEDNRIDLYLQPMVTLPQRKVRYYEAVSRLRLDDGDIVAAGDFLAYAESAGLMPKIDNLLLFRCVQVTRRLQMKNRDIGLFCNMSPATLNDPDGVKQVLDFMRANRSLAGALTFEFKQRDYRNFGPIERECLTALAECGFCFSLDHIADLHMEPKNLAESGFRFLKVPANLLLGGATDAQSDIHPEDVADLLARSGINLIAERIETESTVLDLLDYDVRFGQGFLFSPPRPVRVDVLQSVPADSAA